MADARSISLKYKFKPDTLLTEDGLRYKFKEGGSLFRDSANMSTMSCYRCGRHKSRSLGAFVRVFNQRMFICETCKK